MNQQLVEMLKHFGQHTTEKTEETGGGLNERRFREFGAFDGKEAEWTEFALKFTARVKEADGKIHEAMKWAETHPGEITQKEIDETIGRVEGNRCAIAIYNRLIHHLKGPALTLHQTAADENGLEVWRLLAKRFSSKTPMRGIEIMRKIVLPGKIKGNEDIQTKIHQWENNVSALYRDHKEKVSDIMKIGIMINMMPEDLQEHVLQRTDHIREYKAVTEKM